MINELHDLIERHPLPLSITNDEGETFLDYIGVYLDAFLNDFNTTIKASVITQSTTNVGGITANQSRTIGDTCGMIKQIITTYLKGHTSKAYLLFERLIERTDLKDDLLKLNILKIDKKEPFFRSQKNHSSFVPPDGDYTWHPSVGSQELFHAPFKKRKRVGTNRFSIPGYPCLYISENLFTSYAECTQGIDASFNAICLRNNRPLYIADIGPIQKDLLASIKLNPSDFGLVNRLIIYTKLFPLIATCHMKIHYDPAYDNEVQFKIEYIIPQLLMQWYQNHAALLIDGVRYLSCTANGHATTHPPYNYILPTHLDTSADYCPKLSVLFSVSDVVVAGKWDGKGDRQVWLQDIENELSAASVHRLIK